MTVDNDAADRRHRVLMLPPIRWQDAAAGYRPGEAPDPDRLNRALAGHGIDVEATDPFRWPLNPLARHSTLLAGIDPLRSLVTAFRRRRFDLVISVFEGAAVVPSLAPRLMLGRTPLAMWDIGLTAGWKLRRRIQDLVVPRVDRIFVLGRNQVEHIDRTWKPRRSPIAIGHLVDEAFFHPSCPPPEDGPILSVGKDEGRDYGTLVEAIADTQWPLVIKAPRAMLDARQALPANITVISETIPFRDLRHLYDRCSMVVIPLRDAMHAGGVSAVLEAMAMQRPLIVSASAGIGDYVVPGETCLSVPCGDASALAHAIRTLRAQPAFARRLAERGRALLEERFTVTAFASRFADAMKRTIRDEP